MTISRLFVILAGLGYVLFISLTLWRAPKTDAAVPHLSRVVISAPVLVSLYGGDRFLAANFETIRLAATGVDAGFVDSDYLIRAQRVVSELNPCHEDNYYLANGLLAWGGAVAEGNEILLRAMECRFWDGMPGFFYGFNLSFFDQDVDRAASILDESARRWPENAAALRKLAVMLKVEAFSDERLALGYLVQQRDSAIDPKLRDMLDKRVTRLQGLVELRLAQRRYEENHGALTNLRDLINSGVLSALPQDPLNLGYELRNGRIEFRKLKIAGMENQP